MRDASLGICRFADFRERLGIAPTTLTRRLNELVARGLMRRVRYRAHPPREEYELTPKGRDFIPVLLALLAWGNRWLAPATGVAIQAVDPESGQPIDPVMVDRRTLRELTAGHVAIAAGPGASPTMRADLQPARVLGRPRVAMESLA